MLNIKYTDERTILKIIPLTTGYSFSIQIYRNLGLLCNMTNTITITVAMIAAALLTFVAIPLQALAEVRAGGEVGTFEPSKTFTPETELSAIPEPELPDVPEPELPAIPELSDLPEPELPDIAEPELPDVPEPDLPAIPELSDLPKPEL
jgi:hypothetical protein